MILKLTILLLPRTNRWPDIQHSVTQTWNCSKMSAPWTYASLGTWTWSRWLLIETNWVVVWWSTESATGNRRKSPWPISSGRLWSFSRSAPWSPFHKSWAALVFSTSKASPWTIVCKWVRQWRRKLSPWWWWVKEWRGNLLWTRLRLSFDS